MFFKSLDWIFQMLWPVKFNSSFNILKTDHSFQAPAHVNWIFKRPFRSKQPRAACKFEQPHWAVVLIRRWFRDHPANQPSWLFIDFRGNWNFILLDKVQKWRQKKNPKLELKLGTDAVRTQSHYHFAELRRLSTPSANGILMKQLINATMPGSGPHTHTQAHVIIMLLLIGNTTVIITSFNWSGYWQDTDGLDYHLTDILGIG